MDTARRCELLRLGWAWQAGRTLDCSGCGTATVNRTGEYNSRSGRFCGAEVICDGAILRGDIVFQGNPDVQNNDNCILYVVSSPAAILLDSNGEPVKQAILCFDPVVESAYETLCEDAASYGCSARVNSLQGHERVALFTRLLMERLQRKCRDLERIFEQCESNWNETMYVMLMRTMGDTRNKETYTELAHKIPYKTISRERGSLRTVEALLLGTSGLLEFYDDDKYVRELKSDFEYLRNKYAITAMMPGAWDFGGRAANHPVLRLAQMAAFLSSREFLFDNIIACRTVEEIHSLFRAEASDYWSTHYVPSKATAEIPKRLGHFKANLLGINLVVPMIFSYGNYMGDMPMKERAVELLDKINCEDNRIVNGWRAGGVPMESAFDSQAILQLNNEYCMKSGCWRCPVGKRFVHDVWKDNSDRH